MNVAVCRNIRRGVINLKKKTPLGAVWPSCCAGLPARACSTSIDGGDRLLAAVREVGAEGIIAKRRAGLCRAGPSREWLKTKCGEVGTFIITGFRDATPGEIEAITVAEMVDGRDGRRQADAGRRGAIRRRA